MTLIPQFFLNCVAAIGVPTDKGARWVASGFFYAKSMGVNESGQSLYKTYLVTNRHVLEGVTQASIRLNPKAGNPAKEFGMPLVDSAGKSVVFNHPDPKIDVAVIPIRPDSPDLQDIEINYFIEGQHTLTRDTAKKEGLAEGDLVYVLGFPLELVGGARNYVIVRQGNIARIRDALDGVSDDFLIDASVYPGNSGGPVITKPEIVSISGTNAISSSFLIGIVRAYIPYTDYAMSAQTGRPRVTFEENSGLASVVLVDKINETVQVHLNALSTQTNPTFKPQNE